MNELYARTMIRPGFIGRTMLLLCLAAMVAAAAFSSCKGSSDPQSSTSTTDPAPVPCSGKAVAGLADHLLIGFAGADETADKPGFDLRYQYLAGTISSDVTCSPCSSCNTGNSWWGCWQEMDRAPGLFVTRFIDSAEANGLVPMFTYYILLTANTVPEGTSEATVSARDKNFMTRYFNDFRFFLQTVGTHKAIVHIEPDFWGYAHQAARNARVSDASGLSAEVSTANSTDCASQENSIAGMGRCMITMVRKYAPNAHVGLHASGWGAGYDVILNSSPSVSAIQQGASTADFLLSCGSNDADLIVADISDRDAGYYQSIGKNTWLDATDQNLPNFTQAFTWSRAVADRSGKPILWWQVPVGNSGLPDVASAWKDNRVEYFFTHPDRVAASGAIGMAFGSGATGQTTPEKDNGNLVARTAALKAAGGQRLCP